MQSSAIFESYCSLQTVSAVAAFTLRITEQMGFWKFTSKVRMFDGCYNERICGYTGIHMTLLKALTFKYERSVLFFFNTLKVYWMENRFCCSFQNHTTTNHGVSYISKVSNWLIKICVWASSKFYIFHFWNQSHAWCWWLPQPNTKGCILFLKQHTEISLQCLSLIFTSTAVKEYCTWNHWQEVLSM